MGNVPCLHVPKWLALMCVCLVLFACPVLTCHSFDCDTMGDKMMISLTILGLGYPSRDLDIFSQISLILVYT